MIKLKAHRILISILPLFILFILGCDKLSEDFNQPKYENPIKIGFVGDVSALREQVESMYYGAVLAQEEINHFGGVQIQNTDYDLELIYKNSAGSAEKGLQVTQELIDDGVDIIIGPTFSSVAIEMAELCVQNNILMMTYAATTPELSLLNDNNLIWRTCPSDYTFGTISAQYCIDSLQLKKAAIIYRDDRFGQGLSEIIKRNFIERGGYVSSYVPFPGDILDLATYDFDYEMNSLLKEQVDVIYIIAFTSEIAVLTNEIYNNNLYQSFPEKPFLFLNDGITTEEIIKNVSEDILGTIIGITSTNEENPNYHTFKKNYENRFGFSPSTYSEQAYDAVYCIAYAMLRANSSGPNEIKNYLQEISGNEEYLNYPTEQFIINVNEFDIGKNIISKGQTINYEGASGPINFDYYGDPLPKIVIWGIRNNEFVEISHYEK